MYLGINNKPRQALALVDSNGGRLTYGELADELTKWQALLEPRAVVFCLCENTIGAVSGYLSLIESRAIPLLLPLSIDQKLLEDLVDIYTPAYLWQPEGNLRVAGKLITGRHGYQLFRTDFPLYPVHDDLALLLTTSGSTGSPKLVRHCYRNIEANAKNVAAAFQITSDTRAMADLALEYTMGHSVICSHLQAGATVLLTSLSLLRKEFWEFFQQERATSFTGVPYSYELLRKLRFTHSEWPNLQVLSQGGGRLGDDLYQEFAQYAARTGKKFYATFGQTECTARMALLPPELAIAKAGSIGCAIPNGTLFLIDAQGHEIEEMASEGEMGYRGPNVTMGYAENKEDLLKGDEWNGQTLTGDIARRDEDGYYFIVGRKKRFLKLYGYRVSLDRCEILLRDELHIECACDGDDRALCVYITQNELRQTVINCLAQKTGIFHDAFRVVVMDHIPRNQSGKIMYRLLPKYYEEKGKL